MSTELRYWHRRVRDIECRSPEQRRAATSGKCQAGRRDHSVPPSIPCACPRLYRRSSCLAARPPPSVEVARLDGGGDAVCRWEQRLQLRQRQILTGGASDGPPAMRCVPDEPRELGHGRAGAGGARAPPVAKVLAAGFGAPRHSAHLALLRTVVPVERLSGTRPPIAGLAASPFNHRTNPTQSDTRCSTGTGAQHSQAQMQCCNQAVLMWAMRYRRQMQHVCIGEG